MDEQTNPTTEEETTATRRVIAKGAAAAGLAALFAAVATGRVMAHDGSDDSVDGDDSPDTADDVDDSLDTSDDDEDGADTSPDDVDDGDTSPDDDDTAVGPDREWLEFVKTPHAQLQISRWFNHDHRELPADEGEGPPTVAHQVRLGRAAIGLALRQRDRGLVSDVPLVRLAVQLGYPDLESLLVAVAAHTISAEQVVEALIASVDHGPA